ncbi:MAG: hypothetical protein R2882_08740 [Gemmatimonadales bacterium]
MAIADEFLGSLFGRMVADVTLKLAGLSVIVFAWRRHRVPAAPNRAHGAHQW